MSRNKIPPEGELLIEWQRRLGMQDWAIVLHVNCDPQAMAMSDSEGCTVWEESTKSASIQIADPDKLDDLVRKFDFEEVLVHELLHLKTTLLSSKESDAIEERVLHILIDDLARALIDARRAPYKETQQ